MRTVIMFFRGFASVALACDFTGRVLGWCGVALPVSGFAGAVLALAVLAAAIPLEYWVQRIIWDDAGPRRIRRMLAMADADTNAAADLACAFREGR